jgi:D-glycero-beta-D-manno-heptose-7-phosphate kinase
MSPYKSIITRFAKKNILVIGDLMLDKYVKGSVTRISPEAPVPILVEKETFFNPGGATSVAQNISSLGGKVTVVGRIGKDLEGKILKKQVIKNKINPSGIFVDKNYPTIFKTRVMAHHQQIVRIDREDPTYQGSEIVNAAMRQFIERNIARFDGVIISDYGKGMVSPDLINFVCPLALKKKKIITVDPKVEHFSYYRRVTAITPNLKEAENAIRNIKITDKFAHKLNVKNDR